MSKLLDIIVNAIEAIGGYKQKTKDQAKIIADQAEALKAKDAALKDASTRATDLQTRLDAENLDDVQLEALANAAKRAAQESAEALKAEKERTAALEARNAELEAGLVEVNAAADRLAVALNENPETPSVDGDFTPVATTTTTTTTTPPPAPPRDPAE